MAEEHATRVATAIPVSDDLVTKADLHETANGLHVAIHELRSELLKWMFISQSAFAGLIITLVKFL